MRRIVCLSAWLAVTTLAQAQTAAGVFGSTGIWKVFTADTLAARQWSVSASYDRINRNPGALTAGTATVAGAFGITDRLEFGTAFEANKRVVVGRPDQLSFGQQALGFFGNHTPGSPPLPGELVSGSTRLPQLRSPATGEGMLTGATGYYDLLPFAGLVREGGGVGQVSLALKFNVLSESSGAPMGIAVRGHFDIPIRKGIDYLLLHPIGTADLQFGFEGIASRNIGNSAEVYFNAGYRHIDQPVHVSVIRLADEVPLGMAWNVPRTGRVQFVGEATAEVFVGSHTPNTTFGAEDPVDVTLGLRVSIRPQMILSAGYRRPVNQYGGDKNGFVINAAFVSKKK
jgi:hypothetical protein